MPAQRRGTGLTPRKRLILRRTMFAVAGIAGVAVAAQMLINSSDELFAAADDLSNVSPLWVGIAVIAEMLCYLTRGAAQRKLLVSAELPTRHRQRTRPDNTAPSEENPPPHPGTYPHAGTLVLAGTVLAGDAVAYCLPFGFAAAGVVSLRVLRRRGVGQALVGWMFGVATLLYIAVLAVLAVVAAQLAGDSGVAGLRPVATTLLAVMIVALAAVVLVSRLPPGTAARLVEPIRSHLPRPRFLRAPRQGRRRNGFGMLSRATRAARNAIGSWWAQVRRLRLGPAAIAVACLGMLASWLADIGVLAASYAALGTTPPWTGLLLAYCAGQVASSVPVTPGGIGVVEGSLTLALVAFGGSTEMTLAAVLLYRLISHWACVPAGGLAWLALRYTARRYVSQQTDLAQGSGAELTTSVSEPTSSPPGLTAGPPARVAQSEAP